MENRIRVGVIMGSKSDLLVMSDAIQVFKDFGVSIEVTVVSAHRTPDRMFKYAKSASDRGLQVIVAAAGGAAHLPGMVASITHLPVIGVPIKSSNSIDGWDSIVSILQMPGGIPVATVALNGAKNAALLAIQMLAISDAEVCAKLLAYKNDLKSKIEQDALDLESNWKNNFGDYNI